MRAAISNTDLAEKLGLDHTTISRYRSGDRVPSLSVMLDIAVEYNWDLHLQAISKKAGRWHEGFEAALIMSHGEAPNDDTTTPETAPA